MTKRWLKGRLASSICATALASPRKASVCCAPRSVIGPGFAATSPRKMRTPRSSEYVIEKPSGRAITSAFTPPGRAAVSGRSTGALWVTCARTYACAPVTLIEAIGAPPGPVARTGAVSLGVAAGVEGAGDARDPVEPQAASERIARNTRTRIPTKVVGPAQVDLI